MAVALMESEDTGPAMLFEPVTLPCGRVVPNRLVKVAMYEHLAAFCGGPPNEYHFSLYTRWARANWGMILTGNVQVSGDHLTLGRDIIVPTVITDSTLEPFKQLASAMSGTGLAIMQLSHAGRQSSNFIGGRLNFRAPFAPSSIRVGSASPAGFIANTFHRVLFRTPRSMSLLEIDAVVECFVKGARVAVQSGFDGIQVHAAHGYLLAQFLSPKTNLRQDRYSHQNAISLVHEIIAKIRAEAPPQFVIGVKLNAADYSSSASEESALTHVVELANSGCVDFIEISGGDYDNPAFMESKVSVSPRQAFFSQFSREALSTVQSNASRPPPLILLTGGFHNSAQLYTAIRSHHAQLLGIGRFSVLHPELPSILRQQEADGVAASTIPFGPRPYVERDSVATLNSTCLLLWKQLAQIKLVGSGVAVAWYTTAMRRLATPFNFPGKLEAKPTERRKQKPSLDLEIGVIKALGGMWLWLGPSGRASDTDIIPFVLVPWVFPLVIILFAMAVVAWRSSS